MEAAASASMYRLARRDDLVLGQSEMGRQMAGQKRVGGIRTEMGGNSQRGEEKVETVEDGRLPVPDDGRHGHHEVW